jgi:cytoskeletal protein RodZ
MIKKQIFILISLVFVVSLMMAACIGTSPTAYTEESKSAESVATEEPTAESVVTQEPTAESVATEEPTVESVDTAEPTAEIVVTEEPKTNGPRTGEIAPDFTLPDSNGDLVHLADELNDNRMVVLVFYHDSW